MFNSTPGDDKDSQAGDEDAGHAGGGDRLPQEQPGQDGGEHVPQADQGVGVTDLGLGQHDEPDHKSQTIAQQAQENVDVGGRLQEDGRQGGGGKTEIAELGHAVFQG